MKTFILYRDRWQHRFHFGFCILLGIGLGIWQCEWTIRLNICVVHFWIKSSCAAQMGGTWLLANLAVVRPQPFFVLCQLCFQVLLGVVRLVQVHDVAREFIVHDADLLTQRVQFRMSVTQRASSFLILDGHVVCFDHFRFELHLIATWNNLKSGHGSWGYLLFIRNYFKFKAMDFVNNFCKSIVVCLVWNCFKTVKSFNFQFSFFL